MKERENLSKRGAFSRRNVFSKRSEWITCLVINTFFCLVALVLLLGVFLALALNILIIILIIVIAAIFFLSELALIFTFRSWRRRRNGERNSSARNK